MADPYNKEQLLKFINDALNERPIDKGIALAAAKALVDVFNGENIKKKLGLVRKQGQRKKAILDPDYVYIDNPLFGIVQQLVDEKITPKQARQAFRECGVLASDKTLGRYIESILPRAEATNKTLRWLESLAEKK